jgi:hypothetical protein
MQEQNRVTVLAPLPAAGQRVVYRGSFAQTEKSFVSEVYNGQACAGYHLTIRTGSLVQEQRVLWCPVGASGQRIALVRAGNNWLPAAPASQFNSRGDMIAEFQPAITLHPGGAGASKVEAQVETITVTGGTFDALRVTETKSSGAQVVTWYSPEVPLGGVVRVMSDGAVVQELVSFQR